MFYTVEDLERLGVDPADIKRSFKIKFFNKTFVRSSDLPKKFRGEACKICEIYKQDGLDSFIVEHSLYFTVWTQEKIAEPLPQSPRETPESLQVVSSPANASVLKSLLALSQIDIAEQMNLLGDKKSEEPKSSEDDHHPEILSAENPSPIPKRTYRGVAY